MPYPWRQRSHYYGLYWVDQQVMWYRSDCKHYSSSWNRKAANIWFILLLIPAQLLNSNLTTQSEKTIKMTTARLHVSRKSGNPLFNIYNSSCGPEGLRETRRWVNRRTSFLIAASARFNLTDKPLILPNWIARLQSDMFGLAVSSVLRSVA